MDAGSDATSVVVGLKAVTKGVRLGDHIHRRGLQAALAGQHFLQNLTALFGGAAVRRIEQRHEFAQSLLIGVGGVIEFVREPDDVSVELLRRVGGLKNRWILGELFDQRGWIAELRAQRVHGFHGGHAVLDRLLVLELSVFVFEVSGSDRQLQRLHDVGLQVDPFLGEQAPAPPT